MVALFYFVCALVMVAYGSHDVTPSEQTGEPEGEEAQADKSTQCLKFMSANLHFAFNAYKYSASKLPSKNIFFSPLSISIACAMLSEGARSRTHEQIIEGLGFNLTDFEAEEISKCFEHLILTLPKNQSELSLSLGNALFLEDKIKLLQPFNDTVKEHYHSEILRSNFGSPEEATQQINEYVEKHTNGKIKNLIDRVEKDTKIVIVNYIYLKGLWMDPFSSLDTSYDKFLVNEHTTVEVPMMKQTKLHKVLFDTELPCTVVHLPYKGNAYMMLVLPEVGKMEEVEDGLSANTFTRWIQQSDIRNIELYLPKFSIMPSFPLEDTLLALGMTDMFTKYSDLSGIAEKPPLMVGKAGHKAFLVVDEDGTEAAAATFLDMIPASIPEKVRINRPFLLFICSSEAHQILFMGRVENPLES